MPNELPQFSPHGGVAATLKLNMNTHCRSELPAGSLSFMADDSAY
jgi:hypothetical protein